MSTPYLPPLDRLPELEQPEFGHLTPWLDYLAMGFGAEHVPELIRMVLDETLDTEGPEGLAYVHAWRTLGLLRAEAAIEPLLEFLAQDNDWVHEELSVVFGMIGPAALEPLRLALARWSQSRDPSAAGSAAGGLVEIAQRFPETRETVIGMLTRQLRWWARQHDDLNAMLVHDLVELNAVEAAPVIQEAFAADAVDTSYGDDDWEDVQVALGLLPERITPRPAPSPATRLYSLTLRPRSVRPAGALNPAADPKRRRKAEKAARQRNRRRR